MDLEGRAGEKGDFKPGHWLVEMRGRLHVLAVTFGPDICLPLNNTLDSVKEWWPGPGWHCALAKVTDSRPLPLPLSLVNTHPGHWWVFLWIIVLTPVCLHLHLQSHLKYPLSLIVNSISHPDRNAHIALLLTPCHITFTKYSVLYHAILYIQYI